jgi:uncharacterized protein YjdB
VSGSWVGSSIECYTDANGQLEVDLAQGLKYAMRIGTRPDIFYYFTCPDLASADLFDYTFPYVKSLSLDKVSYSLAVGDTYNVVITATYSDGETTTLNSRECRLVSADTSIVSVSGLTLTGVSSGSTTVEISSFDESALGYRQDMMEDYIVSKPTTTNFGVTATVTVS